MFSSVYFQPQSFDNAGYERIAHKKGTPHIRGAFRMVVRKHVQAFKFYGGKASVSAASGQDYMFETGGCGASLAGYDSSGWFFRTI